MKKIKTPTSIKFKFKKEYICYAILCFFFIWCSVLCFRIKAARLEAEKASYIYVYDANTIVQNYPKLVNLQKDYQTQLVALSAELKDAQAKIAKVEDKKAKDEVSKAYMSQIVEKRNNLVANYNKNIEAINVKVNKAMEDVTIENNLPAVFNLSSIAVRTPKVVDITPEVLKKLK